jgi:hypothetical protein
MHACLTRASGRWPGRTGAPRSTLGHSPQQRESEGAPPTPQNSSGALLVAHLTLALRASEGVGVQHNSLTRQLKALQLRVTHCPTVHPVSSFAPFALGKRIITFALKCLAGHVELIPRIVLASLAGPARAGEVRTAVAIAFALPPCQPAEHAHSRVAIAPGAEAQRPAVLQTANGIVLTCCPRGAAAGRTMAADAGTTQAAGAVHTG